LSHAEAHKLTIQQYHSNMQVKGSLSI